MRYPGELHQLLKPYFAIGNGNESEQHLGTLEALDDRLDAFSAPEYRSAQGSILSEIADIHTRPESADTVRAEAALDKSDAMQRTAVESEELFPIARRELIFNGLRRARIAGTMASALRPTLHQLSFLARQVAAGEYLAKDRERAGFTSEMLGLAAPLWMTLERPEAGGANRSQVGWTSYARQDRAPINRIKLAKAGVMMLPRHSFDIRLSTYDEGWIEIMEERRKIQIKSRKAKQRYEDDITVSRVWQIGNIRGPDEAVSLAASFGRRTDRLSPGRLEELRQFAGSFLEEPAVDTDRDTGSHMELVTI